MHDAGQEMTAHLDLAHAQRPGRVVRRVNVDFPEELLEAIDREARRIGVTRQAFIKLRLADTVSRQAAGPPEGGSDTAHHSRQGSARRSTYMK